MVSSRGRGGAESSAGVASRSGASVWERAGEATGEASNSLATSITAISSEGDVVDAVAVLDGSMDDDGDDDDDGGLVDDTPVFDAETSVVDVVPFEGVSRRETTRRTLSRSNDRREIASFSLRRIASRKDERSVETESDGDDVKKSIGESDGVSAAGATGSSSTGSGTATGSGFLVCLRKLRMLMLRTASFFGVFSFLGAFSFFLGVLGVSTSLETSASPLGAVSTGVEDSSDGFGFFAYSYRGERLSPFAPR